jgi:hypothetical protein
MNWMSSHLRENIHLVKNCVCSAERLHTACLCDKVMSPSSCWSCCSARRGCRSLLNVWSDVTDFWLVKNPSAFSICERIKQSKFLKHDHQRLSYAINHECTSYNCTLVCDFSLHSKFMMAKTGIFIQSTNPFINFNAAIFWDTAPRSPHVNWHFRGMYRLHLQGWKSATLYMLVACSADFRQGGWFSTLKMEVTHSSQMSVHIWTTQHYILEGGNSHNYRCENLKFYFH